MFKRLSSEASLRHLTVLCGGEVGQFKPAARLRLVLCGDDARAQGDRADPDIKITRWKSKPEKQKQTFELINISSIVCRNFIREPL